MHVRKIIPFLVLLLAGCSHENTTIQQPTPSDKKLYVVFTIDVEDNRGDIPYLIEGNLSEFNIENNCGINFIMDTFEQYNSQAVFFVNIYEHNLYNEDYMPSVLKRIDERGHEVALHSHAPLDHSLEFYTKKLTDYSLEEQKVILNYGRNYIFDAIGKYPISYRAGAYHMNDDIFKVLQETNFLIDSSVYYDHKNNLLTEYENYHNQVFSIGNVTEIPVELLFDGYHWKKLDLEWLTEKEICNLFDMFYESDDYNVVQIMLHSFSFLDLKGNNNNHILCQDGNKSIYGEDFSNKEKLNNILKYLTESDKFEIITFEDYLNRDIKIPEYSENNLIYLKNNDLAFGRKDIEIQADQNRLVLNNTFKSNELNYAWQVYNDDFKYESGYTPNSNYEVEFSENGIYYIKAFVKNNNGEKSSYLAYTVEFSDGEIISINKY